MDTAVVPYGTIREVVGWTGSRDLTDAMRAAIDTYLDYLATRYRATRDVKVVHGGCLGVDEYVSKSASARGIPQVTIFPSNMSQAATACRYRSQEVVQMPEGSTYRQRNEAIVKLATTLVAVPRFAEDHPRMRRSGTWMTIRIARRRGVPLEVLGPFDE